MSRGKPTRKPIRKSKPRPSTALVRRPVVLPAVQAVDVTPALSTVPMMAVGVVGTLVLKPEQIDALRRPVRDEELDWKPTRKDGPADMPYLAHNGYRDRLDAAFGLGGWGMVPVGMPQQKDAIVYVPYALVVGGIPRVYAWGEQEYHENNRQMTYGDCLEACKSNAILRCGKELGIARELWSKRYLEELRRRLGPRGGGGERREESTVRRAPEHQTNDVISEPQRNRLSVIIRNSGRTQDEVRAWVKQRYGFESSAQIPRRLYDAICEAIESPRDLS